MTTPDAFDPFAYNRSIRDSDLSSTVRLVAMTLATYAGRTGQAWPSQDTLADGTGLSRRTVNTALSTLAERGWLTRTQKGSKGRATLYQLHLPEASSTTLLCNTQQGTVQLTTAEPVVSCTPTPQGERLIQPPEGGFLQRPSEVPEELWQAAEPLLDHLLRQLLQDDADRFCSAWPLAKARDFCWRLTEAAGCNPTARPRIDQVVHTPGDLVAALTAVPLTDVLHVGPALYSRLVRLSEGRTAVPPREDPRLRARQSWRMPEGIVGDAITKAARNLAAPDLAR